MAQTIDHFQHNGQPWQVVKINRSYYARSRGSDTGPYSTREQARDWVLAISPPHNQIEA